MGSSIRRSWDSELENPEFQPRLRTNATDGGIWGKSCKSSNFPFCICKMGNGISRSLSPTLLGGSDEETHVKCAEGPPLTVNAQ